MRRRSPPERFDWPWLVVRDPTRLVLECSYHPTNPRDALMSRIEALWNDGWTIESPEASFNLSFVRRGSERWQVSLEAQEARLGTR